MDRKELLAEIAETLAQYHQAREDAERIIKGYARSHDTCLENCFRMYDLSYHE